MLTFSLFFWVFHPPSGASHKLTYTAFDHGGRNFSPALLAATAFHFVSKCDVSGVASRQILFICLITCVYFAGATLKSCYESVADGFWFHFVLNVFSFVVAVVIVIVGILHSNTLGKIRDNSRMLGMPKKQKLHAQNTHTTVTTTYGTQDVNGNFVPMSNNNNMMANANNPSWNQNGQMQNQNQQQMMMNNQQNPQMMNNPQNMVQNPNNNIHQQQFMPMQQF